MSTRTLARSLRAPHWGQISHGFRNEATIAAKKAATLASVSRLNATGKGVSRLNSISSTRHSQTPVNVLGERIHCIVKPAPGGHPGTVATVTLSNPNKLNSLSSDLIMQLTSTLRSLHLNEDIRCVIIQGGKTATRSPSFSSGANIFQMAKLRTYDQAKKFITEVHQACKALRDIQVPTLARIDGLCLGAGLELVSACDFRYATQASTFGMPETKYGIPSVIEARLLANIIGWQKTKEMVYFAKTYKASDMEKWGLVDQSCDVVEELDRVVSEAVETITSHGPLAMREQKRLCRIWEETGLIHGIEAGVDCYARMFSDGGSEPGHYMKAFTERKR